MHTKNSTPIPEGASPANDEVETVLLAEDLYNEIMGEIEPDLRTDVYLDLDFLYAGETPEEREAREARYPAAFAECSEVLNEFSDEIRDEIIKIQKQARKRVIAADADDDTDHLQGIEHSLSA